MESSISREYNILYAESFLLPKDVSNCMKKRKKELFTIPNLLSIFRLLLIPVYISIYLQASKPSHYYLAGGVLAISCLTDMVDGLIARQFNMITNVGKVLDPAADKFTQLALTACLSMRYPILYPILALFLVKECFQLFACILYYRQGKGLDGALMAGKVCTTVLFVSLLILMIFPGLSPVVVNSIALTDAVFLTISFVQYILAYFGKNAKLQDLGA